MSSLLRRGILPLDLLTPADESSAGGKAFNCARLKQAGFRVPDGLVVLASATDEDLLALEGHSWFEGVPADTVFAEQAMGRLTAPELGPTVKSFCGRLYFNLSQIRRACRLGGVAPAVMLRSVGHSDAIKPADETAARPPIGELLSCAPDLMRMVWRHVRVAQVIRAQGRGCTAT